MYIDYKLKLICAIFLALIAIIFGEAYLIDKKHAIVNTPPISPNMSV